MQKFINILIVLVISIEIILSATYLVKNDIIFHTDIARDFLLLDEISQKKIILIGPRASGLNGLFHGPLWLYLNYPIYTLSNGNPVIVGWWWLFLSLLFLLSVFIISYKLFNKNAAFLSILFTANLVLPSAKGLFNPYGAMFVFPLCFYFLYKYIQKNTPYLLAITIFLSGVLIQFQLAFGVPIAILINIIIVYKIIKNKSYSHLLFFLIYLIPLSTFLLFDIRHNFTQIQSILSYFLGKTAYQKVSWAIMFQSRLDVMFFGMFDIGKNWMNKFNVVALLVVVYSIINKLIINSKNKIIYIIFTYLFLGFFILSFTHNGWLLYYYYSPFIPLCFIMLTGIIAQYKKPFLYILFLGIGLFTSFQTTALMINDFKHINNSLSSWKFLHSVLNQVVKDGPKDFGIYIYTPDILAYQAKYAVLYAKKTTSDKQININEKRKITYVIEEPPPQDRPEMDGKWWIKERIKISNSPIKIFKFQNNYLIKKYVLTPEDVKIPSDPLIHDWITMR